MPSLSTYAGPWTDTQAAHLLRRACYGASAAQIAQVRQQGLAATIDQLFTFGAQPEPPLNPENGLPWVDGGDGYDITRGQQYYNNITKSWWTKIMITDGISVREKLTVFWSNHFATEMSVVGQALYSFKYLQYLRENALGNFKDMTRQITVEEAMLVYLNGNTNTKGSPNENFARELQELFTIGKGAEVGPGDYTNYTEEDVRSAAKVLTGWRVDRRSGKTVFVATQHETSNKQFSDRYQNRVIIGRTGMDAGMLELNDLLDMIFTQNATAEYLVRKFYRYFLNSDVTEDIERDVVQPLANDLRTNGYNVAPVLRKLLSSEHFFEDAMRGCQLSSPADMIIGLMKTITTWSAPSDRLLAHRFYIGFATAMASQQMDLGEPPSVAGWEAYYQEPGFYHAWLTTATLPLRNGTTDALFIPNRNNDRKVLLDTPLFVKTFPTPDDALALIDHANLLFFAIPFSEATRMKLAEEVLMDGAKYYEWGVIWQAYASSPNATNTAKVKTYLDRLFTYMFRMAEFQLF